MTQTLTLLFCMLFLLGGAVGKQAQPVKVPVSEIYQQDSTQVVQPDSSSHVPFNSYPTITPTQWRISFLRLLKAYIRDLFCKCQCPPNKPSTSPAK